MNNRTAAALVYRHRQHLINVFIWPEARSGNNAVATLSKQGYNLAHWTREGMVFWAVSDVRPADLAELAELLQALPHS